MSTHHLENAYRLLRELRRSESSVELLPRSFVVALVSEFDAFVSTLLKFVFSKRPEVLRSSERNLTLADLLQFNDIEAAKDSLLDKEVETVIRMSHSEQFAFMEKRFGISLREGLPAWQQFVEVTERRNLFVHSNGSVSQQYLNACRQSDVKLDASIKVGSSLGASNDYFVEAYSCVYEIGVKLGHVVWRKFFAEDREAADGRLNALCLDLIAENEYRLAATLLDFACVTIKRYHSESARLIFVINRAQAYKWLNEQRRCEELLAEEDWSACESKFILAGQVLRDEFDNACSTMKAIGATGGITESSYGSWPLFQRFRATPEFLETFREIFGKDLADVGPQLHIGADGNVRKEASLS